MPDATSPLGIFDSGVGGLTVARTIIEQLPNESKIPIGEVASGISALPPLLGHLR